MDALLNRPLISTEELARKIDGDEVRVVDGSWRLNPSPKEELRPNRICIPGAVPFDLDKVCDKASMLPHMAPSRDDFTSAVSALGLKPSQTIVVYDDSGLFSAARVWWTFKRFGWPHVFVLDGGLPKWIAEQRPIASLDMTQPKAIKAEPVVGLDDSGFAVATADGVVDAINQGKSAIVDARPAARFLGQAPEPRAGLRSGAMPGAVNLPYSQLTNEDGTLKSKADLESEFDRLRLPPNAPIIATCGSGVTAAIIVLALERIGRSDHALYDGSWAEWGDEINSDKFPVIAVS